MHNANLGPHFPNLKYDRLCTSIEPLSTLYYYDFIRGWNERIVPDDKLDRLRPLCGHVDRKGEKVDIKHYIAKLPFVGRRQYIVLYQPSPEALREFLKLNSGFHPTGCEVSVDQLFPTGDDCRFAFRFVDAHAYKRYSRHEVRFYDDDRDLTRYTNRRRSATNLVGYWDRPSKLAAGYWCHSFEWRISNSSAMAANGLATLWDLLRLDHCAFWLEHMTCYEFHSLERLGIGYSNRLYKTKRRQPHIILCGNLLYNVDLRLGSTIARLPVHRVLELARQHKAGFNASLIQQHLSPLDVSPLFPVQAWVGGGQVDRDTHEIVTSYSHPRFYFKHLSQPPIQLNDPPNAVQP